MTSLSKEQKKKRENLMMLHDKSIQRTKQSSNKTPEIVSNYKSHKKKKKTNLQFIKIPWESTEISRNKGRSWLWVGFKHS